MHSVKLHIEDNVYNKVMYYIRDLNKDVDIIEDNDVSKISTTYGIDKNSILDIYGSLDEI